MPTLSRVSYRIFGLVVVGGGGGGDYLLLWLLSHSLSAYVCRERLF